jgi:hypothetical protein
MAEAKIEIKVGGLTFAGEGTEDWLGEQLDKLLDKAGELAASAAPLADTAQHEAAANGASPAQVKPSTTLAAFLGAKAKSGSQNKRFLATAEWLTHKGQTKLTTGDITKALSDNHQTKLSNASECLNQNAKQGNCQKEGKQFYVTPEGRASLG